MKTSVCYFIRTCVFWVYSTPKVQRKKSLFLPILGSLRLMATLLVIPSWHNLQCTFFSNCIFLEFSSLYISCMLFFNFQNWIKATKNCMFDFHMNLGHMWMKILLIRKKKKFWFEKINLSAKRVVGLYWNALQSENVALFWKIQ